MYGSKDNALYSLARGSVVVSGHVVAVQGGRTLRSDSVVYFPDQNRVEALGGLTRRNDGGTVSADRAEITIDINRERKNQGTPKPKKINTSSKKSKGKKTQPERTQPEKKSSGTKRRKTTKR